MKIIIAGSRDITDERFVINEFWKLPIEAISKGKMGKKTGPQSKELIEKRAKAISLAQMGKKRPRKICPICDANLDPLNYAKHGHGENCRKGSGHEL